MQSQAAPPGPSRSFPPVIGNCPRVLVLGSLPGRVSLEAGQYYAQPRNAFWRIMGVLCGAHPALAYQDRLEALQRAGIALWDVLFEAMRTGSLDSNIVAASERINDLGALISSHNSIALVAFNGLKAADVYRKRIEPGLSVNRPATVILPSTSPAHASLRPEQKLERWREALMPWVRPQGQTPASDSGV